MIVRLRCRSTLVLGLRQLNLNAVDTIDAVDEQDQDEDEGDLQAVLEFGDQWVFGDEGEELALHGKGERDDEGHEDHHLEDEEGEDLKTHLLALLLCVLSAWVGRAGYGCVDERRHSCGEFEWYCWVQRLCISNCRVREGV